MCQTASNSSVETWKHINTNQTAYKQISNCWSRSFKFTYCITVQTVLVQWDTILYCVHANCLLWKCGCIRILPSASRKWTLTWLQWLGFPRAKDFLGRKCWYHVQEEKRSLQSWPSEKPKVALLQKQNLISNETRWQRCWNNWSIGDAGSC